MLKINHIQKRYGNFTLDCTMEVSAGSVTGLIGQNGAGKSTAFKAALSLIRPDGGSVEIFGKDAGMLGKQDKKRIGVALSDSGFSNYLSVHDIARILKNMYEKYDHEKFLSRCQQYGLPLKQRLKEFSTGMKAKLKMLVALSHEPDLLILDEPTVGLDVVARDEMLELLREYMEHDENRSILISSHISSDLEGLCDDIYMIHDGQIVFHEETDILLSGYALLKTSPEQFANLDKTYILKHKKEPYGYRCLTNQKQFYVENYPDVVVEKGDIDSLILLLGGDEE